ncbi:hypothetical protein J7T55_000742 [Diaporthe amygdali]|uniref:uncharacterized protein n=1 Tax=Phomopsis amygdali TaxID=1214568 RepID=UPI0022FE5652|nr:uncharacterized protein J7T55_000742 [Diaporthe amygdali]KAJ0110309.1 hypothetical protein J7T55_000742 [Diaporthe amygdali]
MSSSKDATGTKVPADVEKQDTGLSREASVMQSPARMTPMDPHGLALLPPPTNDPLDPLNWTRFERGVILAIVCYAAFLTVYCTTTTVPSFFLLQDQFNATYSEVNWSFAIPSLGAAISPLIFTSLGDIYGRRVVLVASSALTLVVTGCATIQDISFGGYMTCRFLQGFFAAPACGVSFGIIRDISWDHERGLYTGFWVLSFDFGFIFVGGFTAAAGAVWAQYHVAIAFAVLMLLEIFFLPETLYPRDKVLRMVEENANLESLPRTKELILWYSSTVSVVTMVPAAYAQHSTQIQGLLFLGLIIGNLVAEIICSGRLSDWLCTRLALCNEGVRTPEMRLWLCYLGILLGSIGPTIWGLSIDYSWHWMVGEAGFFLCK